MRSAEVNSKLEEYRQKWAVYLQGRMAHHRNAKRSLQHKRRGVNEW